MATNRMVEPEEPEELRYLDFISTVTKDIVENEVFSDK